MKKAKELLKKGADYFVNSLIVGVGAMALLSAMKAVLKKDGD